MYHKTGHITGSAAGEVYKTNIDNMTCHSLLNKIMQYQEVPKNKYVQFGIKTETIQILWLFSKRRILTPRGIIRWNCFIFMSRKACT